MTWWMWVLLWVALVAGSLAVLFVVVRSLWRKALAVFSELGTAGERLSAVRDVLETITASAAQAEELAVFADPARLRQERFLADRARKKSRGAARTGASR